MQQSPRSAIVVALIIPLLAACAVMVDPEALLIRCEFDPSGQGRDPCLELGQQCVDGMCRACDSDVTELCNGRDDDCDGKVDEGHDTDGDGFTWCGGGRVEVADCVDRDKAIHPADASRSVMAPIESCDGKDNDCDARVDENRDCEGSADCNETGCPEGQRCDTTNGICIVPREVGSGCTTDSDCRGGFCVRPEAFGLPVALMDNRCAAACCSTADCDNGSTCVIAESGARACLPKTIVGGGSRNAGARCVRNADCASGLCMRNVCQTRCFHAGSCPNQACVLTTSAADEPRFFMCGEPAGRTAPGEECGLLTACRTNLCADGTCATPCGRDGDCETGQRCQFVEVQSLLAPESVLSLCRERSPDNGETEFTESLCCTNEDCVEDELCLPNAVGTRTWRMSCRTR